MNELVKKIEKCRAELAEIERTAADKRAFIAGLEEALKLQTRPPRVHGSDPLRPDTQLFKIREVLRTASKPMHIDELIRAIGKDPKEVKISLVGSLGQYTRRKSVFTRPAPNTFGLMEFNGGYTLEDLVS